MRLAPESHKRIEEFLRDHLGDAALELPPVFVYGGRFTRWFTDAFQVLAITFGRRVFVAPKVIVRDERGRLAAPAALIAHEATHVLQYARSGFLRFLISYVWEYWRALREQPGWGKAARQAAYFAIRQEREAYAAEAAFRGWLPLEKRASDGTQSTLPPTSSGGDGARAL